MNSSVVLIIANKIDLHADKMVEVLTERGQSVFRWNTSDILDDTAGGWTIDEDGSDWILTEQVSGMRLSKNEVKSAFYRRIGRPQYSSQNLEDLAHEQFVNLEIREFVDGVLRETDCLWINHPNAIANALFRLPQRALARQVGFQIPRTIVTNDPGLAREFVKSLRDEGKEISIKRLANSRMSFPFEFSFWNRRIPDNLLEEVCSAVKAAPTMLQEYVQKKVELRVVMIGDQHFCSIIHSQETRNSNEDWREGQFEGLRQERGELPNSIAQMCKALLQQLNLVFGAFDFIVTPDDRYVFLEVNPTGQWLWMETELNFPISATFADMLIQ